MNFLTISMLFFCVFTFSKGPEKYVLFLKDGKLDFGSVVLASKQNTTSTYIVTQKKYSSASNLSEGTEKVGRADVIPESSSLEVSVHGKNQILKKGMIVLSGKGKPFLIEAVFPNGKILMMPLDVNSISRFRLAQNNNFAPRRGVNPELADAADLLAVEQDCVYQKYCRGKTLEASTVIEGRSLCPDSAEDKEAKTIFAFCRTSSKPKIGAVFSDGTLLLDMTLVNPFVSSDNEAVPRATDTSEIIR